MLSHSSHALRTVWYGAAKGIVADLIIQSQVLQSRGESVHRVRVPRGLERLGRARAGDCRLRCRCSRWNAVPRWQSRPPPWSGPAGEHP